MRGGGEITLPVEFDAHVAGVLLCRQRVVKQQRREADDRDDGEDLSLFHGYPLTSATIAWNDPSTQRANAATAAWAVDTLPFTRRPIASSTVLQMMNRSSRPAMASIPALVLSGSMN